MLGQKAVPRFLPEREGNKKKKLFFPQNQDRPVGTEEGKEKTGGRES